MPINPIPGKGLEITLDEYNSLQVSLGGADLWSFSNQQLLTKKFAPFLPRMEYNSANNSVVATMLLSGEEVMGSSRPIPSSPAAIPYESMAKLQNAIETAKEEAAARVTDPSVRELILAFSFPNPQEAPELYRLVGSENAPRLVLLWGLEKRGCQNIPLESMQLDLHFQAMRKPLFTKKNLILGGSVAGAALLAALLLRACFGGGDSPTQPSTQTPAAPAQAAATAPAQPATAMPSQQATATTSNVVAFGTTGGGAQDKSSTATQTQVKCSYDCSSNCDSEGYYRVTLKFTTLQNNNPVENGLATVKKVGAAKGHQKTIQQGETVLYMKPGRYTVEISGSVTGSFEGINIPIADKAPN